MIYRYIIVIRMKPSINLDKKDPKICLLTKILKHFDDRSFKQIVARNNIKNINMMIDCIKIILITINAVKLRFLFILIPYFTYSNLLLL